MEKYNVENITVNSPALWLAYYKKLLAKTQDYSVLQQIARTAQTEMTRVISFNLPRGLSAHENAQYKMNCKEAKLSLQDYSTPLIRLAEAGFVQDVKNLSENVTAETLKQFGALEERIQSVVEDLEKLAVLQKEQIAKTAQSSIMRGHDVAPETKNHYSPWGIIQNSGTMSPAEVARVWASAIVTRVL